MKTKLALLLLSASALLLLAAAGASAGGYGGSNDDNDCNSVDRCGHHHYPPPVPPPLPPPVTTPPPVTLPPPVPPNVTALGYCVQTINRGWSYVQLYPTAFDPGKPWRTLYDAGATVRVAGIDLVLAGKIESVAVGVIVAPIVKGVGATCDQPWVTGQPAVVKLS